MITWPFGTQHRGHRIDLSIVGEIAAIGSEKEVY